MKKMLLTLSLFTLIFTTGCEMPEDGDMPAAPEPGQEDQEIDQNDDDIASEDEYVEDMVLRNKFVFENTDTAKGEGFYGVMDGETRIYASFMVPKAEEDYFYEGWLICEGEAYSTGELEFFDGLYENVFVSTEVPTVCDSYILTLEPNDGDPAPAEHVIEGEVQGVAHTETSIDWDDARFEEDAMKEVVMYTCEDAYQFTLVEGEADVYFFADVESGVSQTLNRAVSASGEKFVTEDQSLTVWFKGQSATLMEGEEVTHSECVAS